MPTTLAKREVKKLLRQGGNRTLLLDRRLATEADSA
jgi:hypothetical protein